MLFAPDLNKYFIDEERITETTMLAPKPLCILWAKLQTPASH
jgi:hypothetical protein